MKHGNADALSRRPCSRPVCCIPAEDAEDLSPILSWVDSVLVNPVEEGAPGKASAIGAENSQQENVNKTTPYNSDDSDVKREAQQNIGNDESIAHSTTTCNDIVTAEVVCGEGVRTGTESNDADENHRKDQSIMAPKET